MDQVWLLVSSFLELHGTFIISTVAGLSVWTCHKGKSHYVMIHLLLPSVCLSDCPDSLESRGKQTLHQCEILRYNFGFNLDPLCGWQQLETLDDVLSYHFSIKFILHSNLPTHCHKVVARVNSSVGRVFDFLWYPLVPGIWKNSELKNCQVWVFEKDQIQRTVGSAYVKNFKEPPGFHERTGEDLVGLGEYLILSKKTLRTTIIYNNKVIWSPQLGIHFFDSQLRFGAISNVRATLVNSSFLADFVARCFSSE